MAEQMRALAEQAGQIEQQARAQSARFLGDMKAFDRPLYAPLRSELPPESFSLPDWDDEEESALLLL
ncbi:hypothetical protein [Methylibium sp.]|uniref:hypothetical protein n=1 Tax=Methylibium sp. TaxID=2067992 RepID=UPI001859073D|nr:hypothetical protein [Methylibium sp.]MBA3588197.1 hypothetical protein [Methylibium sp.]